MKILALDIANSTGYAHNCFEDGMLRAGNRLLGTKTEISAWGRQRLTRRQDPRFCRLVNFILSFGTLDAVVFEDVQFVKSQVAGQLWPTLRAAIWASRCGADDDAIIESVPVQTLKLFATGKGGAGKAQMCRALASADSRFSARGETVFDSETKKWLNDDAVDAIWLWKWGQQYLSRHEKR